MTLFLAREQIPLELQETGSRKDQLSTSLSPHWATVLKVHVLMIHCDHVCLGHFSVMFLLSPKYTPVDNVAFEMYFKNSFLVYRLLRVSHNIGFKRQ